MSESDYRRLSPYGNDPCILFAIRHWRIAMLRLGAPGVAQ